MDVTYTIGKDLEAIDKAEREEYLKNQEDLQKEKQKAKTEMIDEIVDRMLQLYCLLPHKPADPNAVAAEE